MGWGGAEPSSEPMSERSFGTPRPISARLEGAAFDWVGEDRGRGAELSASCKSRLWRSGHALVSHVRR